jgi:hypothetical protein
MVKASSFTAPSTRAHSSSTCCFSTSCCRLSKTALAFWRSFLPPAVARYSPTGFAFGLSSSCPLASSVSKATTLTPFGASSLQQGEVFPQPHRQEVRPRGLDLARLHELLH